MHFSVAVITKGKPTYEMILQVLAPYEEGVARDPEDARYDWFQVGGRFAGSIQVDKRTAVDCEVGEPSWTWGNTDPYMSYGDILRVDSARVKDIIQYDKRKAERLKRTWELILEDGEPQDKEERFEKEVVSPDYYLDLYGTKENFVDLESRFRTYAVVTKDGKWHEFEGVGVTDNRQVGDEYRKLVFENAEEDDFLTVVDCHI